jgi:transcriptional regulator with XRE-family HTH domain
MNSDSQEPRSVIFARNVRRLREDRGWSQAELGRRLGSGHTLRQARVATIEATGSVTIDQADAFADALGVPIEVLLYAEPPATKAVQAQRLLQIFNAVDAARNEVGRLTDEILAEIPGTLGGPGRGAVVTADRIEYFDVENEEIEYFDVENGE